MIGASEKLRVKPEGMGRLGEALARQGERPVFIFGGIPGEEVLIEVVKERRKHIVARVLEVLEPSPHRVTPQCPYFGQCTGCQWQHIDYRHQLEIKRHIVVDALQRVGGFGEVNVRPTLSSPTPIEYRNHARFTVGPGGVLGFVNRETRRFVRIDRCLIMHPGINDALARLQGHCTETTQLSIRYGIHTGDLLVQPLLHGPDISLKSGQKHYSESLAGHAFRIASPSFFQVNTLQAERIVEHIRRMLHLTGDEALVDAYAGVATFAVLLSQYAKRVIAIEESTSAIEDAQANVRGTPSIELVRGKTEDVLAQLDFQPDALVLDPPRTGCDPRAIDALVRLRPKRVVYVSCDPATLARDLKLLCQGPFKLEEVQPVDMFPQTHHVECLASLALNESAAVADVPQLESIRTSSPPCIPLSFSKGEGERMNLGDTSDFVASPDERSSSDPRPSAEGCIPSALLQICISEQVLVLASASPRRRQVLENAGVPFVVVTPSVDEDIVKADGDPAEICRQRALAKARQVASQVKHGLVVAADTEVVVDGNVLGKPKDAGHAREMLRLLRDTRGHQVITGVAAVDAASGTRKVAHQTSTVTMRQYTDDEIEAYVMSGRASDKAGAYGVQDDDFRPVQMVDGCFLNVVGLPLCTLAEVLKDLGRCPIPLQSQGQPDGCEECSKWMLRG